MIRLFFLASHCRRFDLNQTSGNLHPCFLTAGPAMPGALRPPRIGITDGMGGFWSYTVVEELSNVPESTSILMLPTEFR